MKIQKFEKLLIILAILLILINVFGLFNGNIFTGILTFPFLQILSFIKWLVGKGRLGNVLGIGLYVFTSLSPLFFLNRSKAKKGDFLLIVLSISLFLTLYLALNSNDIKVSGGAYLDNFIILMISITNYSILLSYFVLKFIKNTENFKNNKLYLVLNYLLMAISVIYLISIFGISFTDFINTICNFKNGSVHLVMLGNNNTNSFLNYLAITIEFLRSITDDVFGLLVSLLAIKMFSSIDDKEEFENRLNSLYQKSRKYLKAFVLIYAGGNLFNILSLNYLQNSNISLDIPIFTIIYIYFIIVISSYMKENIRLKEYNDLFI